MLGSKPLKSFDVWGTGIYEATGLKDAPGAPVPGNLFGTLVVIKSYFSFQIFFSATLGYRIYIRRSESEWMMYKGEKII